MAGRKKTKYMLHKNGQPTGRELICDDIKIIFDLDQRNISKYTDIEGRRYLKKWNFVPVYAEEKKKSSFSLAGKWGSVTNKVKEKICNTYYVIAKKNENIGNYYTLPDVVYKIMATTKEIAMEYTAAKIGNNYTVIDATKNIRDIERLYGKSTKIEKIM